MFAHRMFHVAITLIMHLVPFGEPILGENICQNFIKISIPPSASCKMSKTSTQNLGNCFQSCVVYNGSSNMISRNAYTTECLCCQDVPSEDVFSSGNWISYSFACPVGYTEVTSHTTRACLRFVNSSVNYTLAASDCQQQGGDLIKIDTGRIGLIFIDFLFNYTTADERVDDSVWIQGQKDVNGIWRFHDGSKMPSFFQYYMVESNFIGEDRLRYRIPMGKFLDRQPTFPHSYMCEYRFF